MSRRPENVRHVPSLLAYPDDMIEDGGVQRPFELAARLMTAGPKDLSAAPFKAWQHHPQAIARSEFHEALQTEAGDGKIGDVALEPRLARPPHLYRDLGIAPFSQALALFTSFYTKFCAHVHTRPLRRILTDCG